MVYCLRDSGSCNQAMSSVLSQRSLSVFCIWTYDGNGGPCGRIRVVMYATRVKGGSRSAFGQHQPCPTHRSASCLQQDMLKTILLERLKFRLNKTRVPRLKVLAFSVRRGVQPAVNAFLTSTWAANQSDTVGSRVIALLYPRLVVEYLFGVSRLVSSFVKCFACLSDIEVRRGN